MASAAPSGACALLLNLLVLTLFVTALGFAIFLERRTVLVGNLDEFLSVKEFDFDLFGLENYVNRYVWNQALSLGGAFVGGLAFVAFQLRGRRRRRGPSLRKLRRDPDALLLRPFPPEIERHDAKFSLGLRSLLGLTFVSIIAGGAVSTSLGMHIRPFSVFAPIPYSFTYTLPITRNPGSALWHVDVTSTDMTAVVYQSAFYRTVAATGDDPSNALWPYLSREAFTDVRIGRARYPNLRTRGVGGSARKLRDTNPWNQLMPGLEFHVLEGITIGSKVWAHCDDETKFWNWTYEVLAPRSYHFNVTEHRAGRTIPVPLSNPDELTMKTWLDESTDSADFKPERQIFILPQIRHTTNPLQPSNENNHLPGVKVIACDYYGQDTSQRIRVRSGDEMIEFLKELESLGGMSWPSIALAAHAIDLVINLNYHGGGGALMNGMTLGGIHTALHDQDVDVDLVRLLEDILTDAMQGYFSILRQNTEEWHLPLRNVSAADGLLTGVALRIGGGRRISIGALAVLVLLPLMASFRLALSCCESLLDGRNGQEGDWRRGEPVGLLESEHLLEKDEEKVH